MQDIQRVLREAHVAGARAMKGHQPKDVADTVGSFDHWKNHIAGNQLVIKAEHLLERQVGYFAAEDFSYDWNYETQLHFTKLTQGDYMSISIRDIAEEAIESIDVEDRVNDYLEGNTSVEEQIREAMKEALEDKVQAAAEVKLKEMAEQLADDFSVDDIVDDLV